MPSVQIGDQTVVIEKFSLAKAMRVMTLLKLIRQQVPGITTAWADFRKQYADQHAVRLDRIQAKARFGEALDHLTDEDWERANQTFVIPGSPSAPEVFFEMFPLVYEEAEQATLRLLGLVSMSNDKVNQYVNKDDIWERVDEHVNDVIKPAGLDEIMELALAAFEVIDGQVLTKATDLKERAGNAARRLGWKKTTNQQDSGTSSGSPEPTSTDTASSSQTDSTGPLTRFEGSPGMTSEDSSTQPQSEPVLTS